MAFDVFSLTFMNHSLCKLVRNSIFYLFPGLLSLTFRQTNIVWVAFIACQSAGPLLLHAIHSKMLENPPRPVRFSLTLSGQFHELIEGIFYLLTEPSRLFTLILEILYQCGGYLIVWLCFAAFLVWNDGVVLGDKSAHIAVFHPTQILYFSAFSLCFSAPFFVTKYKAFLAFVSKHYFVTLVSIITSVIVVQNYTMAHPYLLADNRHYPFYLWRKIIDRNWWSKYLLIPIYIYGAFCVLHVLRRCGIIFLLTYPFFVGVNLTPQLLLEFRYFILPFLMYRLHVRPIKWWKLILETIAFLVINAFTIAVFVMKEFRWQHDPDQIQRIMW